MKIFALLAFVLAVAVSSSAATSSREAILLDDIRSFFGGSTKFEDLGAAEVYLQKRFPEGTSEGTIRSTVCQLIEHLGHSRGMDVQYQLNSRGEALHFVRIFDPKAPALYRLSVYFSFDADQRLKVLYPMIVSELESWDGPLDAVTPEEPNQSLEPTTLLVMPRACARVTPSRVVAHL